MEWGVLFVVVLGVLLGFIVLQASLSARHWRRVIAEGDGEALKEALDDAFDSWRTARPPRGQPAADWQGLQSAALIAADRDRCRASLLAGADVRVVENRREHAGSARDVGRRIAVAMAERLLYEIPHVHFTEVQIDVFALDGDSGDSDDTGDDAGQRCVLTTRVTREAATLSEWDLAEPPEILAGWSTREASPGSSVDPDRDALISSERPGRGALAGGGGAMTVFRFFTAGESHGRGLTAIVEGVPHGLPLTEDQIAADLRRRQGGYGRGKRQQIEQDRARITSGVRHGRTIGSPIALWIENADHDNANWRVRMAVEEVEEEVERVTLLRPGHADLAGTQKYGTDDVRPILERSSARETAARVAVGAIARALLAELGVTMHSHTIAIGDVTVPSQTEPSQAQPSQAQPAQAQPAQAQPAQAQPAQAQPAQAQPAQTSKTIDWEAVEASPVRVADAAAGERMVAAIDAAQENLDTLGGVFEVRASGLPIGLGSHVQWDRRLDGRIAQAFMSINAVKGVEIGDAFTNAGRPGSTVQDVILPADQWRSGPWDRASNRAGGLEGGMTNGQEVVVRAALKPISTTPRRLPTADLLSGEAATSFYERSDTCVVPAAGVIGEAMLAIVLAGAALEKFGGDHVDELRRNCRAFVDSVGPREPRA